MVADLFKFILLPIWNRYLIVFFPSTKMALEGSIGGRLSQCDYLSLMTHARWLLWHGRRLNLWRLRSQVKHYVMYALPAPHRDDASIWGNASLSVRISAVTSDAAAMDGTI